LTPQNFERLGRLDAFAQDRGHTLLDLAFGWLLGHPEVATVIASASSLDQVRQNVQAAGWSVDPADLEAVGAI
jgi:aryl-alcohol dehydrogenase-like predicted oxidoreductase